MIQFNKEMGEYKEENIKLCPSWLLILGKITLLSHLI